MVAQAVIKSEKNNITRGLNNFMVAKLTILK